MSVDNRFDNTWTDRLNSYLYQLGRTASGWRGKEYALDRRVRSVELADKLTISAAVQGTSTYECKLLLSSEDGEIDGECSCPVASNCKHCVAVAFIVLALIWRNGSIFSKTISKLITHSLRGEAIFATLKIGSLLQREFLTEEQSDLNDGAGEINQENTKQAFVANIKTNPSERESHSQIQWWIPFIANYKTEKSSQLLSLAVQRYFHKHNRNYIYVLPYLRMQNNPIAFLRNLEEELNRLAKICRLDGIRSHDPALKAFLESPEAGEIHESWQKRILEKEISHWLTTSPTQFFGRATMASVKIVWLTRKADGFSMLYYQLHHCQHDKKPKPMSANGIRRLYSDLLSKASDMPSMDEGIVNWVASLREINYGGVQLDNVTFPLRNCETWATLWGSSNKIFWEDGTPIRFNPAPTKLGLSDRDGQCEWTVFGGEDIESAPLSKTRIIADHQDRGSGVPENLFIFQDGVLRPLNCLGMPATTVYNLTLSDRFSLQSLAPATGLSLVKKLVQSGAPIAGFTAIRQVRVKPSVELRLDDANILWISTHAKGENVHFILRQSGEWSLAEKVENTRQEPFKLEDLHEQEGTVSDIAVASLSNINDDNSGRDLYQLPAKEDIAELENWLEKFIPENAQDADIFAKPGCSWKIRKGDIIPLIQLWNARPARVNYLGTKSFKELVTIRPAPRLSISAETSGINWLELSVEMEEALKDISSSDLLAAMAKETEELVTLSAGIYHRGDLDEYLKKLNALSKAGITPVSGRQRLHAAQLAGNLESDLLEIADASEDMLMLANQIRRALKKFKGIPSIALGKNVTCQLRPYQKEGVDFLCWAGETFGGATLADEMGLGKTLQMLLMIATAKKKKENAGLPSLVICPASVQQNWRRETERFAPWLKVGLLESGKGRYAILDRMGEYDILVKNYSLTRRDQDKLRGQKWLVICVDEAQAIKNPSADITKAVKSLDAKYRFALTGTPLENRLTDLWSIIDFAVPGYLPQLSKFEAQSKDPDGGMIKFLRARLRPVLLRRLKSEVAKDLPPRIEERLDCQMTPAQKKVYLLEAAKARLMVQKFKGQKEAGKEKIMILAALTRLRQICCDPAVLGIEKTGSGKAEELIRLVAPLMESGKKVLVFSQFVRVLNRLEERLAQEGIKTRILTGKSQRRQEIVDDFENDKSPSVFLISLKAGGTGLNLVSASYVVLFDPWWNPAIESQAIDRAHRIGQDKTVVAFRLVAANTIEERILELQGRKREMIKNILEEESFNRTLTKEDFEFLLNDKQTVENL